VQAALLLHREEWKPIHQRPGVDADPRLVRHPALPVHPHALHPATRRVALEDVSTEIHGRELLQSRLRPSLHSVGLVAAGLAEHETGRRGVPDQSQGLARCAQAHFDLRADRHPFEELPQGIREITIPLVAAVEADLVAQEAAADPDPDGPGISVTRWGGRGHPEAPATGCQDCLRRSAAGNHGAIDGCVLHVVTANKHAGPQAHGSLEGSRTPGVCSNCAKGIR